ncbi:MAG: mandelate racemase/muconate lactonizing enzyme family protein [Gammaproteobacteria bacterium]|nr:mandelate racemase/muconate lactonizing enzyme family protein [Gammaproteobacteria bacterium]
MKLKIDRIEVFGVAMPLAGTFTSGGVSKSVTKCVVVRLTATDGTVGISSIDPASTARSPNTGPELAVAIRDRLGPAIIGQDARNIRRLNEMMSALTPEQPGAVAGVELACVELVCQAMGIPLHGWLGGAVEDRLRFNGWIGELPPEEAATEARRWLQAGFKSAKIKVGSGVDADHDRVAAVREVVGGAMQLRMDANQQYDTRNALELCRRVRQYDLQLFEQPVPKDDLEGLARIRREGGIPIMADESISDHESLIRVIKADCADYVKFGIKQVGSLLRAASMLETAQAAGLPVVLGHGFGLDPSTMAEIMLASTSRNVVPGLECVGPLKVVDSVASKPLDISSGSLELPMAPGLGISLDDAKLAEYGFEF